MRRQETQKVIYHIRENFNVQLALVFNINSDIITVSSNHLLMLLIDTRALLSAY